jgi:hypothetical protein
MVALDSPSDPSLAPFFHFGEQRVMHDLVQLTALIADWLHD